MADDNPYNSLGQILSQGGEIALGLAIAGGWSDSQISTLFAKRFDPMLPSDRDRLMQLAHAAVEAGERINNMPPGSELNLDDIPINPDLFGDEPGGRRIKYVGTITDPEGKGLIEIRGDLSDALSADQMTDAILEEAIRRVTTSPQAFKNLTVGDLDQTFIRVSFVERRF